MTNSMVDQKYYLSFLKEVKDRIRSAQYEALKKVNKELIGLYWDIGKMIVDQQKKHGWGKSVVENVAQDLQKEFVGASGFSSQNLWYMRQFYLEYCDDKKLQPLVGEIGWSHNVVIMSKCKNALEREFYIRMTRRMGWSKNVLIHQIENKTYEKTMASQANFDRTLPAKIEKQAKLAVKDEYAFGFLELAEEHSELELERAILARMNRFLVEMGGAFAFMGNQYRLEIDGNEYFIDILLYLFIFRKPRYSLYYLILNFRRYCFFSSPFILCWWFRTREKTLFRFDSGRIRCTSGNNEEGCNIKEKDSSHDSLPGSLKLEIFYVTLLKEYKVVQRITVILNYDPVTG